jgi:DNA-binding GntR family transcriptional regulator
VTWEGGVPAEALPLELSAVRTAHREVADRLRAAILSGAMPAGTRLVQAELAASLRLSVTPVREALRELENQGLVDFDAFRGATVHAVSLRELEEVYALRRALIPLAVQERVATITDDELDQAEAIVKRMSLRSPDAQWVDDNREFHRILDGTSAQPHLRAFLRQLADMSALYVGVSVSNDPERRRRARDDHRSLIAAYRARNPDVVIAITLSHINDTAAVAAAALRDDPDVLGEHADGGLRQEG